MEDFMRNRFLCAAALLAAAAGAAPALAADIPARPGGVAVLPVGTPPAPYAPDWTGFYLGVEGGGGWDKSDFTTSGANVLSIFLVPLTIPNNSASGGVFGFFFGYNWQWGPIVAGLEGNIDGTDIKSTSGIFITGIPGLPPVATQQFKIEELASIRARLGYLVLPNLLLFGTGGIGFDHATLDNRPTTILPAFPPISDRAGVNEIGWVAGAGAEYKLFEHLLLRVEWLHYDFGRTSAIVQPSLFSIGPLGILPVPTNFNFDHRVDTVMAGIAYKF
jgi:outer membrane immunogenic protein